MDEGNADELLKRALLEPGEAVSVALRVSGLALSKNLTVVFHGRRDLGTVQTYVTNGDRSAGTSVAQGELLRVPCDLDLATAEDREEAEHLYVEQAKTLREALIGADTVLSVWQEPLEQLTHSRVNIDRRIDVDVSL